MVFVFYYVLVSVWLLILFVDLCFPSVEFRYLYRIIGLVFFLRSLEDVIKSGKNSDSHISAVNHFILWGRRLWVSKHHNDRVRGKIYFKEIVSNTRLDLNHSSFMHLICILFLLLKHKVNCWYIYNNLKANLYFLIYFCDLWWKDFRVCWKSLWAILYSWADLEKTGFWFCGFVAQYLLWSIIKLMVFVFYYVLVSVLLLILFVDFCFPWVEFRYLYRIIGLVS